MLKTDVEVATEIADIIRDAGMKLEVAAKFIVANIGRTALVNLYQDLDEWEHTTAVDDAHEAALIENVEWELKHQPNRAARFEIASAA